MKVDIMAKSIQLKYKVVSAIEARKVHKRRKDGNGGEEPQIVFFSSQARLKAAGVQFDINGHLCAEVCVTLRTSNWKHQPECALNKIFTPRGVLCVKYIDVWWRFREPILLAGSPFNTCSLLVRFSFLNLFES